MPNEIDMTIAKTIFQQLGGNRFALMTGAHNLAAGDHSLQFKIGCNPAGITHIKISLNIWDLYDVTFYKVRAGKVDIVAEKSGIYFDQLQDIIESETKLALSL